MPFIFLKFSITIFHFHLSNFHSLFPLHDWHTHPKIFLWNFYLSTKKIPILR